MHEKSLHTSQNLLNFLFKKYNKRGWSVFSDHIAESQPVPEDWMGPHPDILSTQRTNKIAVCIESQSTLEDAETITKWKSILDNPKTKLQIVVRNSQSFKMAKQLAEINNCEIECFTARRKLKRQKIKKFKQFSLKGPRRIDWILFVTSIVILSISILLFGPTFIKFFKVREFYSPFDQERQIDQLKKSLNELEKKK